MDGACTCCAGGPGSLALLSGNIQLIFHPLQSKVVRKDATIGMI